MRGKHDGAGPGMEMIRDELSRPIIEAVTSLVATITDSTSDEISRLRALLILGQIHWMNARREEVFRIMRWSKLDNDKLSLIKQTVREHTRLVLNNIGTLPTAVPSTFKHSAAAKSP